MKRLSIKAEDIEKKDVENKETIVIQKDKKITNDGGTNIECRWKGARESSERNLVQKISLIAEIWNLL